MYTYLGKWIMVNNSKCECPFLPAHPWKSPFLEASWGVSPGLPGGSSGRSRTVDWLCLGPAQQRSCIASWGCGPSSRGPDLTIPLCGCHQMIMARCCAPTGLAQGSLSQQVLSRELKQLTMQSLRELQQQQYHQIFSFKMAACFYKLAWHHFTNISQLLRK